MSVHRFLLLVVAAAALSMVSATASAQVPCALTCPANVSIATPPGAGGVVVNYPAPVASGSNCAGNLVQTCGLPSGQSFPIGTTTNCWRVDVTGGGFATCQFTVTVTGTPGLPATPVPVVGGVGVVALLVLLLGAGLLVRSARD
jgi:hypothetical protein